MTTKLCYRVRSNRTCFGPLKHDGACEYERIRGQSTAPSQGKGGMGPLPRVFGHSRGRTKSPFFKRRRDGKQRKREVF